MNCAILQGYSRDCRDSQGGIINVYGVEHSALASSTAITSSSGVITNVASFLASGKKFYKFELELGVGTADQAPSPNAQNGTFFVEQNLTFNIPQHTASISYSIKTLAVNDLLMIVEKNDGTFWLLGEKNGMKMQPSKNPFGKSQADMNGFELTFKGMEPNMANQIQSSLISLLTVNA